MPTRIPKNPPAEVIDAPAPPRGADPAAWHALVNAPPVGALAESPALDEEEDSAEMDAAQRVRAVLGSNPGEGVRVSVYRLSPLSKKREWCADYSPDQFVSGGLPMVLADLGAGSYEWRAFGGRGLLGRGSFDIAANARAANPAQGPAGVMAGPMAPAVPEGVTRALEALAQGQALLVQALQTRPDPMQDMERMMTMAKLFREMSGAPAPATAAPTLLEQINTLRAVKEFVKENQGDSPEKDDADDDNPLSLARPLIDLVKTALQRNAPNAANAPQESAAPMLPNNSGDGLPAVSIPASVNQESDDEVMQSVLKTLIEKANAKADASETGQFLFEHLPDMALPLLRRPDAVALLVNYAPPLAPHRAWLDLVHAECIKRLDKFENK